MIARLATEAEARVTGAPGGQLGVVCVNGGGRRELEGTWSATLEWLVERLAPAFPGMPFSEVRYRVKSWQRLEPCVEDALAAIDAAVAAGARRIALVGFSMGGAVAISAAQHASVDHVVGLAPWIPERLDLSTLRGRRLDVLHGSLDGVLPGIPGVSPGSSRAGFERALAHGAQGSYTLIRGGLHTAAYRGRGGRVRPLPRAGRWASFLAERLAAFEAA